MPTEDEFVTVPLNNGIQLKTDEFSGQPPGLRKSQNVSNETELGGANFLPEMFDLGWSAASNYANALVPADDGAIASVCRDGRVVKFNNAEDGGGSDTLTVTQDALSVDVVGQQVTRGERPVSQIASGETPLFEVFAWLEQDASGVDGAVARVVRRSGGSNSAPMNIPVQNGPLVKFHSIAVTRGAVDECHVYVVEEGATTEVFAYLVHPTTSSISLTPSASFSAGITMPAALDVVENPAEGATDRYHYVAVASAGKLSIFEVNSYGSITERATGAPGAGATGLGVSLDYNAALSDNVFVAATTAAGIVTVKYDKSDFASHTLNVAGVFAAKDVTLRIGQTGDARGMYSVRKGWGGRALTTNDLAYPFKISSSGTPSVFIPVTNMALVGDAYFVEEPTYTYNPSIIFPLAFTLPNNLAPTETDLTLATWPVDPAIVGYMYTDTDHWSHTSYGLHPVGRWGTDRARTGWGRSKISMPYAGDPTTAGQDWGRTILDVRLAFAEGAATASLSNGSTLWAAGLAMLFDGNDVVPACHLWRPEFDAYSADATPPDTIGTVAGTYSYKAVFVWEDGSGMLVRSADSPPRSYTVAAGDGAFFTVSAFRISHQTDDFNLLRCWIYATEDGGSNYYLLTDDNDGPVEGVLDPILCEFSFNISNVAGDPSNPILPFATSPPEIAPQAPNGFYDVAATHSRAWGIDAEDRVRAWFSKITGRFQAPEFNSQLTIDFPDEDGPLTAVSVLGANPVFFKRHTIWALRGGEGPSNVVGIGQPYSLPVKVADMGAADRKGVVSFPGGVVFHNGRSLMLLTQGFQVTPFGAEIQPETLNGVISAAHIAGRRELHFNFDDGAGSFRHFVYTYDVDRWSEWTDFSFSDSIFSAESTVFLIPGALDTGVQLKEYGSGASLGAVRPVPDMVVGTSFIRPGDRNAARRVREVLLEFEKTAAPTAGTLSVLINEEHGQDTKTVTWTYTEIATAYPTLGEERVVLRVVPDEQFESISVELTIPATLNLKPVACTVLFGVEEGVQRRYPEGSTK